MTASPVPLTEPPKSPGLPWRDRLLITLLALFAGLLPAVIWGRVHPDEIFQYLEPALARARGYGFQTNEWRLWGSRNIAAVAPLEWIITACDQMKLSDPRAIRAVMAIPLIALWAWGLSAVYRMARRMEGGSDQNLARFAVAATALWGQSLLMAGRTMSESLSAVFILLMAEWATRHRQSPRATLGAGVMLGLAVVARYGSLVFVPALFGWMIWQRAYKSLIGAVLGFVAVMFALGVLDAFTWGSMWHSLHKYIEFAMFDPAGKTTFGTSAISAYLIAILQMLPILAMFTIWWGLQSREAKLLCTLALVYLLAIFATPHKEPRFLYPALLLLMPVAIAGQWRFTRRVSPSLRATALCAAVGLGFLCYRAHDDLSADVLRSQYTITRPADVTGLLIVGTHYTETGGFFYSGRPIAMGVFPRTVDEGFSTAVHATTYNRAMSIDGMGLDELKASGFDETGKDGRVTMLRR